MWKRKYFHEKKKALLEEERSTQLKTELDQIIDKTIQIIDNEMKHSIQTGYSESTKVGVRIILFDW